MYVGVGEASMLRLNGQGDVGLFGGARGDLLLKFLVSSLFKCMLDGNDIPM